MHRRNQVSKYLKTKTGSLESAVLEAVSAAQQAAIAIAKKEKGEKPKNEKTECPQCEGKGCDHCDGKGYHEQVNEDAVSKLAKDFEKRITKGALASDRTQEKERMEILKLGKKQGVDMKALDKAIVGVMNKVNEQLEEKANFSDKQVKMAIGVASDKRYKGGNYTGAVNAIEKIAKGLSDHPQVKAVLKRQNEKLDKVNPNAVKKDFDDRKDKDIDNDGDVDDSDEYLHKRRKAISKDMKEEVSLAQLAAQHISNMWKESAYGAKKKVDKKEEMDDNEDEGDGKTMTGKPMSKVEVNPKEKEK